MRPIRRSNTLTATAVLVTIAVITVAIAAPVLADLASDLVPLVLVVGVVLAVLRLVWFYTRAW